MESGDLTGAHAEAVVRESLTPLLEAGADTIVLGCTHYPFLLETLRKVAREHTDTEIRFIDPAPAVARQLLNVMDREGIFHGPVGEAQLSGEADLTLLSSGPSCVLCDAARLL